MSFTWLKNMSGMKVGEEELKTIAYPKLELTMHVTTKCVEFMVVPSVMLLGPLVAAFKKETRSIAGVMKASSRLGRRGAMVGVVLGPLMTWGRMRKIESEDAFYDRCFRLRHNHNQVRVDRGAYVGALGGMAIFPLLLRSCPILGSLFGLSLGTIGAGVYNNAM